MQINIINTSNLPLPAYETAFAAGMDIRANLEADVEIMPTQRVLIPTGLFIELPQGFEAQIRPRSGLAFKYGITVLNAPGTIDADYRGEIKVLLINHGDTSFVIKHGERIAQMIIAKHETIQWNSVEQLSETGRGSGGYGSTGKK
ncbi:MAG: dUTP diphosphatase [Bacteroidia bacterium]|nr:dUTP diphosphatase [Bacteroidia bacterium]